MPALLLCRKWLGEILHGNAFSGVCFDARSLRYFGYFHVPDKAVIDNDSLGSAFAFALCFKNINMVDEFTKQRCGQSVHSHKPADCRSEIFAFSVRAVRIRKAFAEAPLSFAFSSSLSVSYLWDNCINHSSLTLPTALPS